MKLRALVLAGILAVAGAVVSVPAASAVTCPAGSLRAEKGDGTATSYAECNLPIEEEDDKSLIDRVIDILNVIVGVVGIVAVAVIVVGGIFFVVSLGDPAKTTRARNTVLYGVVGLFVSLLAFAVVNFAITSVFGRGNGDSSENGESGGGGGGEESGK